MRPALFVTQPGVFVIAALVVLPDNTQYALTCTIDATGPKATYKYTVQVKDAEGNQGPVVEVASCYAVQNNGAEGPKFEDYPHPVHAALEVLSATRRALVHTVWLQNPNEDLKPIVVSGYEAPQPPQAEEDDDDTEDEDEGEDTPQSNGGLTIKD